MQLDLTGVWRKNDVYRPQFLNLLDKVESLIYSSIDRFQSGSFYAHLQA